MRKILGLDLGTNSIGWALVNEDTNKIIDLGAIIFPKKTSRTKKLLRSLKMRNKSLTISFLIIISVLTLVLTLINKVNWQFWMNISLTTFVAILSLLHQNKTTQK